MLFARCIVLTHGGGRVFDMEIAVGVFSSCSDMPMISNFGSGRASSRDRERRMHALVVRKFIGDDKRADRFRACLVFLYW